MEHRNIDLLSHKSLFDGIYYLTRVCVVVATAVVVVALAVVFSKVGRHHRKLLSLRSLQLRKVIPKIAKWYFGDWRLVGKSS